MKQESLFYWWRGQHKDDKFILINPILDNQPLQAYKDAYPKAEVYSAFTVAELGEMLPQGFYSIRDDGKMAGTPPLHACWYNHKMQLGTTEADARAKMLIYLLENDIITT